MKMEGGGRRRREHKSGKGNEKWITKGEGGRGSE